MRKDEIEATLADLEAILGHYKRRYYRATFPDDCRQQADRLEAIAEDYLRQARELRSEILACIREKEQIERHLFRVAFTIERIRKSRRNGSLTREQLATIQRVAAKLAAMHTDEGPK
jgi:hypothetical protein